MNSQSLDIFGTSIACTLIQNMPSKNSVCVCVCLEKMVRTAVVGDVESQASRRRKVLCWNLPTCCKEKEVQNIGCYSQSSQT